MSKLYIIGIGPGDLRYLAPAAKVALEQATDWVGYSLYIELIDALAQDKLCHKSPIGQESERAKLALTLAAAGKTTALISSGDPNIYAMASLVFQLLDEDESDTWATLDIELVPGISAMQLAAARVGAPLGHDFCTISLSDLLTPWTVIERRIQSAATGDFVIAFYNPASLTRNWQIERARDILLVQRAPETPVILAHSLGRESERIEVIALSELRYELIDMLTLVLVGNSQTKRVGRWLYTPRGYTPSAP